MMHMEKPKLKILYSPRTIVRTSMLKSKDMIVVLKKTLTHKCTFQNISFLVMLVLVHDWLIYMSQNISKFTS